MVKKKKETSPDKCPSGHVLPHRTKAGRCTPIVCIGDAKKDVLAVASKAPLAALPPDAEDVLEKEKSKIALRKTQHDARREIVPVPDDLVGESAEKWADEKITKLLPEAVAEIEYQLRFGSDEQRERAANKILDATGRGKQDKSGGSGAPIILLNMQPGSLPWAQRVENKKVGDGNA